MIPLELSWREERLLNAALNPDAAAAVANWKEWQAEIRMEDAPYPELRLLSAVYAHLVRVAPSLKLPNKLRGKARATFAENTMMANECLAVVDELSRYLPVILIKGAGICIRFNAWSSRAMGDVDIQVPTQSLCKACDILAQAGCIPQFGMTWTSLVHRTSLRRNSWNLARGRLQLDLHWRMFDGPAEKWATKQMWGGAERTEFLGRAVLLQSPEFALVTSLGHGFKFGTHGDMLQTIVDCASLLPLCQVKLLLPLLRKTALVTQFGDLVTILQRLGLSEAVAKVSLPRRVRMAGWSGRLHALILARGRQLYRSQPKREIAVHTRPLRHRLWQLLAHRARVEGPRLRKIHWALSAKWRRLFRARPTPEMAMLNRPLRYRLWEILWRRASIERLMLRLGGPLSTPLSYSGTTRDEYDLRDCAVLDEIAGPGWAWPEPDHTGFWSDRADARLLIPLRRISDHLIVLGIAESRLYSLNARLKVFANGMYLAPLDLRERLSVSDYCLMVPQRALFGPWLELSLRPQHYLGHGTYYGRDYQLARGAPLRRLRIYDMPRLSEVFSGQHVPQLLYTLLQADQPQASKFERIRKKIETSQYRDSRDLPADFNPLVYVLSYPDLFEHEVDPYEHFLQYGRWTGRPWH